MAKTRAVLIMAAAMTAHSRMRSAIRGSISLTSPVAMANALRIMPICDALRPRSTPSKGTTRVCTSQLAETNQLTSMSRAMGRWRSNCQACQADGRGPRGCSWRTSGRARNIHQVIKGKAAIRAKAA